MAVGLVIALLVLPGIFVLGLLVFLGKVRVAQPSRPSASFESFFPKILGGFLMLCGLYGLGLIVLGLSGALHQR